MTSQGTQATFALTQAEAQAWEAEGYFVREAALPCEQVARLRAAANEIVTAIGDAQGREYHLGGRRFVDADGVTLQYEYAPGAHGLRVVEPVYHLHPALDALVDDPRLITPTLDLVGAPELALWTAKMNLKGPCSASFGWHQDSPYWAHDCPHVDQLPNVMIALDDQTRRSGCFRVIPGSHRSGMLPGTDDGSELGGFYTDPDAFDANDARYLDVPAGALIFFSPHLVHGSAKNASDRHRRALIYTYQPAGSRALKNGELRNAAVSNPCPELTQLAPLLAVGLVSGFLGGMLGIGGGVVIVPALIILFDLSGAYSPADATIVAVATSLSCIVFTSLSAAYTQYRAGKVRWDIFRRMIAFFVLGSFTAGIIAPLLPAGIFRALIGVFLLFVAVVMLTNWKPAPHRQFPGFLGSAATGYVGGNMAGLAGIAGGNIIVPTLIFFNTPVHNATATSSAMGVPIALAGALSYAFASAATASAPPPGPAGYIDLLSFIAITMGAVGMAPVGVKVAHRVPADLLKKAFGTLLIFVSARMVYSAVSLL